MNLKLVVLGLLVLSFNSILVVSANSDFQCSLQCQVCQEGVCFDCKEGYHVNLGGQCVKYQAQVSDCLVRDYNLSCAICFPSYDLKDGKCAKKQNECLDEVSGSYGTNSICSSVPNCEEFYYSQCLRCAPGFRLSNNRCFDKRPGCQSNWEDGLCRNCQVGYFMSGYTCFENKYYDRRCLLLEAPKVCSQCRKGYFLVDGRCEVDKAKSKHIINCVKYNENKCEQCVDGFMLKQNNSICVSEYCEKDYYVKATGHCQKCIEDVDTRDDWYCVDKNCQQSYYHTCKSCKPGFILRNNHCFHLKFPHCKIFRGGQCLECETNYFLTKSKDCYRNPEGCRVFNSSTAYCDECYWHWRLQNGYCHKKVQNCQEYDFFQPSQCKRCLDRYYLSENKCLRFSELCAEYDNGVCSKCVDGAWPDKYKKCKLFPINCMKIDNMVLCTECNSGYDLNKYNSECVKRDDIKRCHTYNKSTKKCQECLDGFKNGQHCYRQKQSYCKDKNPNKKYCDCPPEKYLSTYYDGICVQNGKNSQDNPCLKYVPQKSNCLECRQNHYLHYNGKCLKYGPYIIKQDPKPNPDPNPNPNPNPNPDPLYPSDPRFPDDKCQYFLGDDCRKCISGYYVNRDGICVPVDTTCKTHLNQTGACSSCYQGYILVGIRCLTIQQVKQRDQYCLFFDGSTCLRCSHRYFFNQTSQLCTAVSTSCKTFNSSTGACLSCFKGYRQNNGLCTSQNVDQFCNISNGDTCKECFEGFYISPSGRCAQVDPECKGYNPYNGHCLDCHPGYQFIRETGKCRINKNLDEYCKESDGKYCKECYDGYGVDINGRCQIIQICKKMDKFTGACEECIAGYSLSNGICLNQVDKCDQHINGVCTSCYKGYLLISGRCIVAPKSHPNFQCRKSNNFTGQCEECYPGYVLRSGVCINDTRFPNCSVFDENNNCIECYKGFIPYRGGCTEASQQCKIQDPITRRCLSCWDGYSNLNGSCVALTSENPFCSRYDKNNEKCIQCIDGFLYNAKKDRCVERDPFCIQYSPSDKGYCLKCHYDYYEVRGECHTITPARISNCFSIDYHLGRCLECMKKYYKTELGTCEAVSVTCDQYDENNGQCLSCIAKHYLQDGKCLLASIYDENCSRYIKSYCFQCKPGYRWDRYRCYRML